MPNSASRFIVASTAMLSALSCSPKPTSEAAESAPTTVSTVATPGNMAECPAWARERVPGPISQYLGRFGLPEPYPHHDDPIGGGTRGIDLWQANHFVAYRPETADWLYSQYTPTRVTGTSGSLPGCEAIVARYTAGIEQPRDKAIALLTQAMPAHLLHPTNPPLGPRCSTDRGMDEDELLATGTGFCNEQARVFVRMCQIAGIPARIIFLFYADTQGGHVIAEFHADGRWAMADTTWFCAFPAADGHLMTAAECHRDAASKKLVGEAYVRRCRELLALSDDELVGGHYPQASDDPQRRAQVARKAASVRRKLAKQNADDAGAQLWAFGIMNYPLPQ